MHQGHVRLVLDTGSEMQLSPDFVSARTSHQEHGLAGICSHVSSIFETLDHIDRNLANGLYVCVAGRSFILERYLFHPGVDRQVEDIEWSGASMKRQYVWVDWLIARQCEERKYSKRWLLDDFSLW